MLAYRQPLGDALYSPGENSASNKASCSILLEHKQRFGRIFSSVSVSEALYSVILKARSTARISRTGG